MLKKTLGFALILFYTAGFAETTPPSSYMPVVYKESVQTVMAGMSGENQALNDKQKALLSQRYDLSDKPSKDTTMSNGEPIQEGVRVKLPTGLTWDALAKMTAEQIREKSLFPQGFLPLPYSNDPEDDSQMYFMTELQEILNFPLAPKLKWDGKLELSKADPAELRGEELFFGKAQCATCHTPPYYTDNRMHNLQLERFYKHQLINDMQIAGDGPFKTSPLRGVKDFPPYLHDGRLLTLADTVEFFNLVLELKLNEQEKQDLTEFMKAL